MWFFDTEFSERGPDHPIQLISIGMVNSRTDDEIYLVSNQFDEDACSDWVKQNVIPKLGAERRRSRVEIASVICAVVEAERATTGAKPEFWGYFADYDWVVFCQLFGRMIDLPKGWPHFCRDLIQVMDEHNIDKSMLPKLDEDEAHNALVDARWTRSSYDQVQHIIRDRRAALRRSK